VARFNYIITIHNKEDLLERTLDAVDRCGGQEAVVYPVLDGCTDRSEDIVNEFAKRTSKKVVVTRTPDVHEIRSINAALRQINEGFTICLQDDVVLDEPDLESKLESLYQKEGPKLGVVSLCRAANLRLASLARQIARSGFKPLVVETDLIRAEHDYCAEADTVEYERLVERMVAIKSPVCIPEPVLKEVGILDEDLAPYSYCDHEYCMRCLKAGFRNGLFPMHFTSELEWGGTRIDEGFSQQAKAIHLRNTRYIARKHGGFIREYWKRNHELVSPG
jgi:GT2 family glycosyltransferase